MPSEGEIRESDGQRNLQGKPLARYDGFLVMPEVLTRSRKQLSAIGRLTRIEKQFIGTMVDTEVAAGYYVRTGNVSGDMWVAYVAVKMKYSGDLAHMAKLLAHRPPTRGWNANTITKGFDLRWSFGLQGIVAYALLREVRPYLHNEKSMIEVD